MDLKRRSFFALVAGALGAAFLSKVKSKPNPSDPAIPDNEALDAIKDWYSSRLNTLDHTVEDLINLRMDEAGKFSRDMIANSLWEKNYGPQRIPVHP